MRSAGSASRGCPFCVLGTVTRCDQSRGGLMFPRICRIVILTAACLAVAAPAAGAQSFAPGAPGIGDPYFPLEGNGGYDVGHYDLSFSYDPATDRLDALNKITATATQDLSRFDLDFQQLTVKGVEVNDRDAAFTRDGQELVITPARGIAAEIGRASGRARG